MKTNNALRTMDDVNRISDEELVRRILSGETILFETVIRRSNQLLYRIAYNVLRNPGEAEEVVQDSFYRAYTHLSQFAGKSKFSTWLAKITLYAAQAHARRRSRFIDLDSISEFGLPFQIEEITNNNPEKKLLASEIRMATSKAIEKLPKIYRSVFVLREIEGFDTAKTASALGVAERVVKTRLHRARTLLRKDLYDFMQKFGTEPVIAIDLGTANIRLYVHGRGVILDEPSLVRIDRETGLVQGVGSRAIQKFNSANDRLVSPLHEGVIVDVDQTVSLLQPFVERAVKKIGRKKPKALVCIPSDATQQERTALVDATLRAGISSVVIIQEPLAAAIGAGIDGGSDYSHMLVDIGDGVTDMAILKSGALLKTRAIRIACSNVYESLQSTIKENYGVQLEHADAQLLTQQLGQQAFSGLENILINGIDFRSKKEKEIQVGTEELLQAITPVADTIVKTIQDFLRDLSDPVGCEIIESGIHLTGGGGYLP
ncbi:sigma-70 family RNA polymerase sigma factor, partial [bacterium]|nr:sigma-70 family RNA polymerase sigma factor [bacterium]